MTLSLRLGRGVVLLALLLTSGTALAQFTAGYGDWQLHLPINRAKALADVGDRIYVAAEDAFFYYDKELNTTQLLSTRDGLHDAGLSTLAFDSVSQQLVIAYRSTNLDILRLRDGAILNIADIARKEIQGQKTVNHINIANRVAYLACSFGIVAVDLTKLEIKDSYTNIGPNGSVVQVYATAVAGGVLYAATSGGVLHASLTSNLLDYRAWTTDFAARVNDPFRTVAAQDGRVYVGINNDRLYRYNPGQPAQGWQAVASPSGGEFRQLTPSRAGLLVTDAQRVSVLNTNTGTITATLSPALLRNARTAIRARNGSFYVADFDNGLLAIAADGQTTQQFITNSPAFPQGQGVLADARTNTVTVFGGGYGERYLQQDFYRGFAEYQNGRWTTISAQTQPAAQYPNPKDLSRGTRTPDGTLYAGSYGNGLLEWKGPGNFRLFNPTVGLPNPLRSAISDANYTRVTDVAADADGKVWVVNRHQVAGQSGLFLFDPVATTWTTVPYFSGSDNLDRIALDDAGNVWVTRARAPLNTIQGINVVNPATNENRYFGTSDGLPAGSEVFDIVKDRNGDIWVATNKGPVVFNDASSAFDTSLGFQAPIVRRGEGTGFRILMDEPVRTIAVDGGNRKWFGTDRGLWLFSADGDEALLHFTTANSHYLPIGLLMWT
ncbi:two-component regulator propeller domain-containing protein [Hymenobacter sp. AT01-02]|uniref:type IX secretion system anionic LPS delivery protein PorZ n=1 Tax=Hymenobacter sp. AT01-02 TaxID=1571877 RepID=UPI0006E3E897|nr:two-component regulator propeller domain-containing protein [Hymenobacter sp. AT01-02]